MERGGHYPKKGGEKGEIQPHPGTSGRERHLPQNTTYSTELPTC